MSSAQKKIAAVEKMIKDWRGSHWAFCPFWVVNIRAALGMDENGLYPKESVRCACGETAQRSLMSDDDEPLCADCFIEQEITR